MKSAISTLKSFLRPTVDPVRMARLIGLSWFGLVSMLIGLGVTLVFLLYFVRPHNQTMLDNVFGFTSLLGAPVSYVLTVFVAVPVAVVLESVTDPEHTKGLFLSKTSWQGACIMYTSKASSLCSHCWRLPVDVYGSVVLLAFFGVIVVIMCVFFVVRGCFLLGYVINALIRRRQIAPREVIWRIITGSPNENPFCDAVIGAKPAKAKTKSEWRFWGSLLGRAIDKFFDIIVALYRRACPTINWK